MEDRLSKGQATKGNPQSIADVHCWAHVGPRALCTIFNGCSHEGSIQSKVEERPLTPSHALLGKACPASTHITLQAVVWTRQKQVHTYDLPSLAATQAGSPRCPKTNAASFLLSTCHVQPSCPAGGQSSSSRERTHVKNATTGAGEPPAQHQ